MHVCNKGTQVGIKILDFTAGRIVHPCVIRLQLTTRAKVENCRCCLTPSQTENPLLPSHSSNEDGGGDRPRRPETLVEVTKITGDFHGALTCKRGNSGVDQDVHVDPSPRAPGNPASLLFFARSTAKVFPARPTCRGIEGPFARPMPSNR